VPPFTREVLTLASFAPVYRSSSVGDDIPHVAFFCTALVYFWRVYLPYSLEQRAEGGISFAESGKVSLEARAQKHFSGMLC
jgi:hypothetical protein